MRRFALLSLFLLATLTACKSPYMGKVVNGGPHDIASVAARAKAGNGDAQAQMGDYYCLNEPKADHGAQTVKWYRAASQSMEYNSMQRGLYNLGLFYLALTEYPEDYDLATSKPKPPCTGSMRSAANDAKAAKYLTGCVNSYGYTHNCSIALALLRYKQKKYAEAYELYASVLVEFTWDFTGDGKKDYTGRLLAVPYKDRKGGPLFDNEKRALFRNAPRAASHLSKAEIARIDARAYAAFYKRIGDENAYFDRISPKRTYNR